MSPLQIVFNDRANQTKLDEQTQRTTERQRNPFGDSDSSDSDSEKPRVRQISSLSVARPQTPPRKVSTPPLPEPAKVGPKGSQIARLVARRKDAAAGLAKDSRDSRDEALFRYDVDRCDEEASVARYVNRPVEGFGEVMLRSMGWRGTAEKDDSKDPTPRPARLGLGAKVEDLPPGMTGKRPRERVNGTHPDRTTEVGNPQLHARGKEAEEEGVRGRDPDGRDGVTAESSEKAGGTQSGKNGATDDSRQLDGSGSTARRRRKRSRFAHVYTGR